MKPYTLLILLSIMYSLACNTSKSLSQDAGIHDIKEQPAIVFMFCNIGSTNGKNLVSIKELREKDGVLKSLSKQGRPNKNTLTAVFYNKEHKVFDLVLQHPLRPAFEVVQKDTHENLEKRLKKAEFSLRFQKDKNITHVLFIEHIENKTDTLNTITIKQ